MGMSDYFIFDGEDSRDYGVEVFWNAGQDSSVGREVEGVDVPGRDGTLYLTNSRMPNKVHAYNCIIYQNYDALADLRDALNAKSGYCRLEDSFHPDEFYTAIFHADMDVETTPERSMARFILEFDRKPQRWLKTGETAVSFTAAGTISNPTNNKAKPLLRVYGTGTVGIGDITITISAADVYTDIDCDLGIAYKGSASKNQYVSVTGTDFPELNVGDTGVSLGGNVTSVEITPRWYRL